MATDTKSWFPLFEFQNWAYQSFLVPPPTEENDVLTDTGTAVTAKTWAKGKFLCGQAFNNSDGYILTGTLSFRPGIELHISAKGALGSGNSPATFEATGTGMEGHTKGAIYQLVGWVFREQPIQNDAGRVLSVRGTVRAAHGPLAKPEFELGGMPIETMGAFMIFRAK